MSTNEESVEELLQRQYSPAQGFASISVNETPVYAGFPPAVDYENEQPSVFIRGPYTPDQYEAALQNLSLVLGKQWVQDNLLVPPQTHSHPLLPLFHACESHVAKYRSGLVLPDVYDARVFAEIAQQLSACGNLSGFKKYVLPRIKQPVQFDNAQYEMEVAWLATLQNVSNVEFIPTSDDVKGKRQPDILLDYGNDFNVYLECKRKDRYILPSNRGADYWKKIQEPLLEIIEQSHKSLTVTVTVPGTLDEAATQLIYEHVKNAIKNGEEGEVALRGAGCVISIAPPQDTPDAETSIILPILPGEPYSLSQGKAIAQVQSEGNIKIQKSAVAGLYIYDSHKIKSIIKTFDDARQLPQDAIGLIYINADTSFIHTLGGKAKYLKVLAKAVKTIFTPSRNTRVWGVILSTGPTPEASLKYTANPNQSVSRVFALAHNVYHPYKGSLRLPGFS